MPRRPKKPCTVPGCSELVDGGRCPAHRAQAEEARGTSAERGYSGPGHDAFREAVLARDPYCVVCMKRKSVAADHHPYSRRQLVLLGLDPNDPDRGRGLCWRCHSRETAKHQPGGWAAR